MKPYLSERQVKATVYFFSVALLLVLTPGVVFKYQSAVPTFFEGWGIIWACVAAALCCILIFARDSFRIVRKYYCVPAFLCVVMAGQYACGIGWDFKNEYSLHLAHKLMSLALLEGKLYYPYSPAFGVDNDYQMFNGAVFTNWGYGVPFLQAPFHEVAKLYASVGGLALFPDRIIFFFYYTVSALYVYFALNTYAVSRGYPNGILRHVAIGGAILWIYTATLYWLVSYRYLVYEETEAYFVLFQINCIASWLLFKVTGQARYLYLLGASAGMGTLIRPTGVLYDLVYGLAVIDKRYFQSFWRYVAGSFPFIAAFLLINHYKSGRFLALGINNSNPGWDVTYAPVRFGSTCPHSLRGASEVAQSLFFNLFIGPRSVSDFLSGCGFTLENATKVSPPFIHWGFTAFLLFYIYWIVRHKAVDLEAATPLLGLAAMFGAYVYVLGEGFAYRYADDFLPFYILMAAVLIVRFKARLHFGSLLALGALAAASVAFAFVTVVTPQLVSITKSGDPLYPGNGSGWWGTLPLNHWNKYDIAPLPTTRTCGDRPLSLPHDKFGWNSKCDAAAFVNVFMAVPAGSEVHHKLVFDLQGAMPDKIYINGGYYTPSGGASVAFDADPRAMVTPNILVSFMWTNPGPFQKTRLYKVSIQ